MAIEFLVSPSVSITQGTKTINVTGSVDTYHVFNGTQIVIGNNPVIAIVEAVSGSGQPDGSGNSTITLAQNWDLPNVVNEPMIAMNTNEGMAEAQRNAREAAIVLMALYADQSTLLNSTDATVTLPINGVDTTFVPYGYLSQQTTTLLGTAQDVADDMVAVQDDLTQAQTDLSNIQGTLDTKVSDAQTAVTDAQAEVVKAKDWATSATQPEAGLESAKTYAAQAATSLSDAIIAKDDAETAKQQAETILDNFDDRYLGAFTTAAEPTVDNDGNPLAEGAIYLNTTENVLRFYIGSSWLSPQESVISNMNSALTHKNDAETAKTLAQQYANHPEDDYIPNTTEYSAYHWKQKTQDLSGGTAPDSLMLGGQLPAYYATASDLNGLTASDVGAIPATGSTSLTGTYRTLGRFECNSYVTAGYGSGGVSLTHNDGYGNANVTFNHVSGTPEQDGNAGRIEVNTDDTSAVGMEFEVKSNVTGGVATTLTQAMRLSETTLSFVGKEAFAFYDGWLRINEDETFGSGIYTGSSIIRTDNAFRIGGNGESFLASTTECEFQGKPIVNDDFVYLSTGGTPLITITREARVTRRVYWNTTPNITLDASTFSAGDEIELRFNNTSGTSTITTSSGDIYVPDGSSAASHTFTGTGTVKIVRNSNWFMITAITN